MISLRFIKSGNTFYSKVISLSSTRCPNNFSWVCVPGGAKAAKKTPVKKAVAKKPAATKKPAASAGSGSPWDDEMASIPAGAVYIEACKS